MGYDYKLFDKALEIVDDDISKLFDKERSIDGLPMFDLMHPIEMQAIREMGHITNALNRLTNSIEKLQNCQNDASDGCDS